MIEMSRKQLIIIVSIVILGIVIMGYQFNKKEKYSDKVMKENVISENILFDEESGLYYLTNEQGEIVAVSNDEQDLEFYIENPSYNPNPLNSLSTDLNDYRNYCVKAIYSSNQYTYEIVSTCVEG